MSNSKDIGSWGTSQPVCPNCGEAQNIDDITNSFEDFIDEETVSSSCEFCDKSFYVQLNITTRYNTFL